MLRRIEEFSELFDGGKSVGFGIKFGIFFLPLRYVPWKIFFDFCFCSTNELQLWRSKNLTKFWRGIIFLVSIMLRYKVGIFFFHSPIHGKYFSIFSIFSKRTLVSVEKKHFENRQESKKKKKFCFPIDIHVHRIKIGIYSSTLSSPQQP